MEGKKETEKRVGWKGLENNNFCTLSLLPLKLSPNPTTQKFSAQKSMTVFEIN